MLGAIPAYLIGLILADFLAYKNTWFPPALGYTPGTLPSFQIDFILDVLRHAFLPAIALILTTMGAWVIGMRGMMVTVQGEDYMTFGEAKGLKDRRLFYRYGVRNAMLPQVTALALSFAFLVSGAVLVELVFRWPGVGTLYGAIRQLDYFRIYGIVLIIIVSIAIAMFVMDMIYPLLDPRIPTTKITTANIMRLRGFSLHTAQCAAGHRPWDSVVPSSVHGHWPLLHRSQGGSVSAGGAGRGPAHAQLLSSGDPECEDNWRYPFGTDAQGRDLLQSASQGRG